MACELFWEPDGVLKRFSETVTAREFLSSLGRVQGDARFDEIRYLINDFSAVKQNELCTESLTEAAALQYGASISNPNCRVVFVTVDKGFADMVLRIMASPSLKSYEVAVLPSVTAARDWLDNQPHLHLLSDVMGFRFS